MQYDAAIAPDPETWLALDWLAREDAVRHYHLVNRQWFGGDVWHTEMHVLAENALALRHLGAPDKLEELVTSGLLRHEALHAIGTTCARAIVEWVTRADDDPVDVDLEVFIMLRIESLTDASWHARPSPAFAWRPGLRWIDALGRRCDRIDKRLRRRILAFDADGVAALVATIEKAIARPRDDTRALRAGKLLRVFEDERTNEAMICAVETEREKRLYDRIDAALNVVGAPALETVIARIERLEPEGVELNTWCELLSSSELVDERILAFLIASLRRSPAFVADCLCEYGDARALALVHREFEALELTGEADADEVVSGFVYAVETLGGRLTARERDLVAFHRAEQRRSRRGPIETV